MKACGCYAIIFMVMDMITIYKVMNRLNFKIYVGKTRYSIEKRFLQHYHTDSPLGNAMRDCGLESFTIETIEEVETEEQAKERERFWIKVLKCKAPNGYNRSDGGEGCFCRKTEHLSENVHSAGKMTIADALKRFREEKGLTQAELADKLGIFPQAYYRYEKRKDFAASVIDCKNGKHLQCLDRLSARITRHAATK